MPLEKYSHDMSKLTITTAKFEDMDFILSLARDEGWNPGTHDAFPFYHTDPNGFFIGRVDGKKIGCISAVAYHKDFGFLGLYIVVPDYRGQGYGIQLWNHAMAYLGTRSIGLDGVIAQQENYKKSHFELYYRNIRFEGKTTAQDSGSLIDIRSIPFENLLNYDTPVFGLQRKMFLQNWIEMPNAHILGKLSQNGLIGYGVIRSCAKGYKIGPLFADNLEVAKEIYQGLCAKVKSDSVFLDVPEINQNALELAESFQMKKTFETARMYTIPPPPQQLDKVYGVTTFELG
jgi:GNAT superfamily N-acetyltransferase